MGSTREYRAAVTLQRGHGRCTRLSEFSRGQAADTDFVEKCYEACTGRDVCSVHFDSKILVACLCP